MPITIDTSLELPAGEFFPDQHAKSGICIHHTVGGTASSSVHHWKTDGQHIGTAYMIGRDGAVFRVFDPRSWAFQFGLRGWPDHERFAFERRFVGIEIASEGGLLESDGKLYCFGTVSNRTWFSRERAFDFGEEYRGFRFFAKYTQAQVSSLTHLINKLCDEFAIPRQTPSDHLRFYGRDLKDFAGIIGHTHIRPDKTDPIPDVRFWNAVVGGCALARVDVGAPEPAAVRGTDAAAAETEQVDLVKLFEDNVQVILKMASMSGSMVKQLMLELQQPDRNTYIRLRDPVVGGHEVHYETVQGDPEEVLSVAHALDVFDEITSSKLVVLS